MQFINRDDIKCSQPFPFSRLDGESLNMWCQFPSNWLNKQKLRVVWRINQDVVFAPQGHVACAYQKQFPGKWLLSLTWGSNHAANTI